LALWAHYALLAIRPVVRLEELLGLVQYPPGAIFRAAGGLLINHKEFIQGTQEATGTTLIDGRRLLSFCQKRHSGASVFHAVVQHLSILFPW
jgi:hypothetical protein